MHRVVTAALSTALAIAAPAPVRAGWIGDFVPVLEAPGNQTQPSIAAQWIVYADDAGGDFDVKRIDELTGAIDLLGGGPGDQDQPAMYMSVVAWRDPSGIFVWEQGSRQLLRSGAEPAAAHPRVSSELVAWEQVEPDGSTGIGVFAFGTLVGRAHGYAAAGNQHGPAPFRRFVAFIDDADGGAIRILDAADGSVRRLCPSCTARAYAVAAGSAGDAADPDAGVYVVSEADTAGRSHVVVYAGDGTVLRALPYLTDQVNPHVSGDWVAYEEIQSDGTHQIRLFDWRTAREILPPPTTWSQELNDVSVVPDQIRVAFVRQGNGLDLWKYVVALPLPPDDTPPPPASCADPAPTVLAEILVPRDASAPLRGFVEFASPAAVPVLVCIDSDRVSSAWVGLDDVALARPSDFNPAVTHLEAQARVGAGPGRLAAVVAGKPGTWLRARVLADPGRTGAVASTSAPVSAQPAPRAAGGCATGGGATGAAVLALAIGVALRRRRRGA